MSDVIKTGHQRRPRRLPVRALLCSALLLPGWPALAQVQAAEPVQAPSLEAAMVEARQLATSGKREEAIARYDALLAQHPGNGDLVLARGRTYAWMDRWAESERDLQAVTTQSPQYADAWSALGDMYRWSDRPQQAAEAYARWAALAPQDPAPRIARGRALRNAGDLAGAKAEYDAALALGAPAAEIATMKAALDPRTANPDATVPAGYNWIARASLGRTSFTGGPAPWTDYDVAIRRKFSRGSLALEGLGVHRFGKRDNAWALDGYVSLWDRAYANLRYQNSPSANLFPQHAWRAELFQGVGTGWELSGSVDQLRFSSSNVNIYSVGVGKYFGNYYARVRTLYVPGRNGANSVGYRGLLRYYYAGDGDQYFEVSGGLGHGKTLIPRSNGLVGTNNNSLGIAYARYLSPQWGFKVGAGFGDEGQGVGQRNVFASVYRRW